MEKIFLELKDKSQTERWTRVIALEKFGKPAVDYLHKALDDDDKWVRYMAADALGNIGDVRSIERLIPLLNDQDQDVRFATAYALGNIGHPSAEDALTKTCSRDNCFVKVAAEEALAKVTEAQKHNVVPGKEAAKNTMWFPVRKLPRGHQQNNLKNLHFRNSIFL